MGCSLFGVDLLDETVINDVKSQVILPAPTRRRLGCHYQCSLPSSLGAVLAGISTLGLATKSLGLLDRLQWPLVGATVPS